MNTRTLIILFSCSFFLGGAFFLSFALRVIRGDRIEKRLYDFVVQRSVAREAGARLQVIIQRELSGSLFSRAIVPIFKRSISYFGRFTPEQSIQELNRQLMIAGNPLNLGAREFYGVRFIVLLLGIGVAMFLNIRYYSITNLLLSVVIVVMAFLLPIAWLRRRVGRVQDQVRRGLPDALDMLSVCATAGLGFDQSLQRVVDYWKTPLGIEFGRVVQEMELGVSRTDALRNMSYRLGIAELSSFVAIMIQAENLGMPIADVLHGQAEQMRIMRQLRAKEIANRLPARMMIPLALLILPALLAVILGPMIPIFMTAFD